MIIKNFLQVKKYLPSITIKSDISSLDDMVSETEQELVNDILGEELHEKLVQNKEEDRALIIMCERIIALRGFEKAIPDLDLVLTQSGFAVHNSEAMSPASKERVKSLINSVQARADNAIDNLIKYLITSTKYDDIWRTTVQFERITAGFISSYSEFKEYAQYTHEKATLYPKNYSEFKRLYTSFNLAVIGEIASYISIDYCTNLLEKYRDREPLSLNEQYVLSLIRYAVCAFALEDMASGRKHVLKARAYMLKNPENFPVFTASAQALPLEETDNSGPIYSML